MTFILGLATADYGVLATDTRSFTQGRFADGLAPKLRELVPGRAWSAAAGLKQWSTAALDALAASHTHDLVAIAEAVRPVAASPEIRAVVANLSDAERDLMDQWAHIRASKDGVQSGRLGRLAVLHRSAAGYSLYLVDDRGIVQQHPRGQVYISAPPGLELAEVGAHIRTTWPWLPRNREEAIERAAELVAWAATRTEYMSNSVEAVYLTPARTIHLGPTPAADLLQERVSA